MSELQRLIQIKTTVEAAFDPLHCIARVYDYETKFRFKVLDQDHDTAFERSDLRVKDLADDAFLSDIIEQAKSHIHARRHRLNFGPMP